MLITKKNIIFNSSLFVIYICLSIITFIFVRNGLHIFLVWNVFLAFIPFVFTILLDKKIINKKIPVIITLLLWLFFFPNSMYIITDLIYINTENFVSNPGPYSPAIYLQDTSSYLAMFHIYLGGVIGLLYGFKSLSVLYEYSKRNAIGKYRDIAVILVFILSAFAIYIGRFFRYNSWDFFRVYSILKDFFTTFSFFTVFFIVSYSILLVIIFYSFKMNFIQDDAKRG